MKILEYLKARLQEKSTKAAILSAIAGAALLPSPWSYYLVSASAILAIVPTSGSDA